MAVNTANYNLKKPSQEDFYNIEDHNGNMDIIDTQIKKIETELEGHVGDTQSHVPHLGITANNGNTYTIECGRTISDGSKFSVKFNTIATGPATLNISSDGTARSLKKPSGEDFKPKAGIYSFIRDGENFQLLGEGGEYGNVTAHNVFKGIIFGTENGLEVGTLDIPDEAWFQPHNQWYKCTPHPATNGSDAIKGLTGCVCDNKLYLFSFFVTSLSNYWGWNVYDPTTNLWTKDFVYTGVTPSYSTYICGVFNHVIYLKIADGTTTSTTDKIYAYDTVLKTMSSFTIKTLETHDTSSRWIMTDENTFYSIGGSTSKLTYSYNRITDTTTSKTNCPVYLSNPSCLYNPYNNTIYVIGNKSTVYNEPTPLYAYDCSANTWIAKADYETDPRYNLSIILKDANTLLIGGGMKTTDTWFSNSFKYYDITTNAYTVKPYAPILKQVGSLGIINEKIYWFGGWTSNGGYDNTYVYFN